MMRATAYTNPRLTNRPPMRVLDPPRAITDTPRMRKGGWRESMELDAEAQLDGLTWYRVRGGFGGHNDREDWIAAVPSGTLSVTGWQMEAHQPDVTAAMRAAVDGALRRMPSELAEARLKLNAALDRERALQRSVAARGEAA